MTEGHTERLEAALDGKYRIERKLGEGGMASVYLAEDIKHKRKVALKILKPELAAVIGAERFLSEIQTTANLQHPHILALFDSGNAGGYLYYVMPYVEGETLRDKLDREKQLGVEESVRIARDVADALDYAHRHGVIHRDIKPANILLHDGRPVVADFGIALAVSAAGGGRMTETGLSLGTPHYMSPEQASADRDLSARSDVYSLGCVLYEMIGGQPPHSGPSAQSILVHILTKEATPLTELRHTVPPHVAATVSKAIEKLPADRFETAKEFMDALGDASFTYAAQPQTAAVGAATVTTAPATVAARPWLKDPRSIAALLAVAVLGSWGLLRAPAAPELGVATRAALADFDLSLGGGQRLAISPDGRSMLQVTDNSILIRSASDPGWREVPNTEGGISPTFSPDGLSVAFVQAGGIFRVPIAGGPALPIARGADPYWAPNDSIVYHQSGALYRVASSGGEPELLLDVDSVRVQDPYLLPNGRAVLFSTASSGGQWRRIMLLDVETGEVRELAPTGSQPRYIPTGHIIFGHPDQALMGMPFDLETLQASGSPVTLLPSLDVFDIGSSQFAVSESGTLIYAAGYLGGASNEFVWVDRSGQATPIDPGYAFNPAVNFGWRLSPDGTRIVFNSLVDGNDDVFIKHLPDGPEERITIAEGRDYRPFWTPDGQSVTYFSSDGGSLGNSNIWSARADGVGEPILVLDEARSFTQGSWSSDGEWLIFRVAATADQGLGLRDIVGYRPGIDTAAVTLIGSAQFAENGPVLSPNGRWLAYSSDETGRDEVFVRPFPNVDSTRVRISTDGGLGPLWAKSGRELFFVDENRQLLAAPFDPGSGQPGRPEPLFTIPTNYQAQVSNNFYDVTADGERFLMARRLAGDSQGEVFLVTNWFTELLERMGG